MSDGAAFLRALLADARPLWDAMLHHPFVQELANGTLAPERFAFWVQQDYLFVREALKARGLAIARAPDEEIRRALIENAVALRRELDLFESYARAHDIALAVEPAPVCLGYAAYRQAAAALGTFPEFLAGTWAAEKAYLDTWSAVKQAGTAAAYQRWIENWTAPGFVSWVAWLEETLARLVDGLPESERAGVRAAFVTTARFEYLFWDMAYRREHWPLGGSEREGTR